MRFPTVVEIASCVEDYRDTLRTYDPADIADEEGNPSGDIRLQVYPSGEWSIHTGSSDYDQDHRGYWGCATVSPTDTYSEIRNIARTLISEAKDSYAMR